ncbi:hypothetical protein ACIP5Z_05990 [Rothia terrae]|uniref:hypothetical protein n=1 Tax=Rothia terrae TaxID=396015 RepID=UPI0037F6584A
MNNQSKVSRRHLARGAAWVAPVVIATAATPVYAASTIFATLTSSTYFLRESVSACSYHDRVYIQELTSQNSYLTVNNLKSTYKLSNLATHVWLPVAKGTTFSCVTGGSTCWSVPTATGASQVRNGYTFYEYVTTYTCAITFTGTSWTMPSTSFMNFVSSCQPGALPTATYHYTQNITVTSGAASKVITKDNGWANAFH